MLRKGVCAVVVNSRNQVLICKTVKTGSWQFPQGGIDDGELPIVALARELKEEIGDLVGSKVVAETNWISYLLPGDFLSAKLEKFKGLVGQMHKYYLIIWDGQIEDLDFSIDKEFNAASWVPLNLDSLNYFSKVKKKAYSKAILELLENYTLNHDLKS
jgi:putative (di)nucleoside polyphosphate hydrolase